MPHLTEVCLHVRHNRVRIKEAHKRPKSSRKNNEERQQQQNYRKQKITTTPWSSREHHDSSKSRCWRKTNVANRKGRARRSMTRGTLWDWISAVPFSAFTIEEPELLLHPKPHNPWKKKKKKPLFYRTAEIFQCATDTDEGPANENLGCLWAATSLITVMNENTRVCVARAPIKSGFAFNVHHLNG